jgi:hypothetical protein
MGGQHVPRRTCHTTLSAALSFMLIGVLAASTVHGKQRIAYVDPSQDAVFYPVNVNEWWGAMNQRGRLVILPQFDWSDASYDGWIRIVVDGETGFIRSSMVAVAKVKNSKLIIKPQYAYADRFQEKFAIVGDGKKFGFIDITGKRRTKIKYDEALRFKDGLAAVRIGARCGFIDVRGKVVVPLKFASVRSFNDNRAMAQQPAKGRRPGIMGYINRLGRYIWRDDDRRYDELGDFYDGFAKARVGRKWGYITKTGKLTIKLRYQEVRDFHNGYAAVRIDEQWGYIDKRGKLKIRPRFDTADDFDETLAMVSIDGEFGYVDKAGKMKIKTKFLYAEPFLRKYAVVETDSGLGYIDINGNRIWDPRRALNGFTDKTRKERRRLDLQTGRVDPQTGYLGQVEVSLSGNLKNTDSGNRTIAPPRPRDPVVPPYPPDHLYIEQLPQYPEDD